MNPIEIKQFLLWNLGVNYATLLIWFGIFCLWHDQLYLLHTRWFKLSIDTFDTIHYSGMAIYKIGVLLFNLTPMIVLYIIT